MLRRRDAQELLTEWGFWVWEHSLVPSCKSSWQSIMRDRVQQSVKRKALIADDDAMRVDALIAELYRRSPQSADCVRVYYSTRKTQHEVARCLGLRRLKVRELLLSGVAYIDGRLDEQHAV